MKHPDLDVQWRAAEALASMGPSVFEILVDTLDSRSKDIRLGAIEALGDSRDPRAVVPLVPLLKDPDNEIRWEAALALGMLDNRDVIPPLRDALRDRDRFVREGAALSLERLSWVPEDHLEEAYLYCARQDWDALSHCGSLAILPLDIASRDKDPEIRLNAARTLGAMGGEEGIPLIYRHLRDPDDRVRWEAVRAAPKTGLPIRYIPRGLSKRPRVRKNPGVAAVLNLLLPGMGYLYLGRWWGVVLFQVDVYVTLWLFTHEGGMLTETVLLTVYILLALHAWYIARHLPDL
ncbi:HEAT repeat protein [Methanolinea mesophila]|uniref:HEAT repeat domain-containing protein n=1 Tax=Methanolinea mesophila TaxID=547055 RepID=UPI001AE1FEE9|nr:HEAT repeat domain-containing protein [Methanolinea mesophila]MBP1928031.1 HEAT repeat protein [Methanolinea mesophila]